MNYVTTNIRIPEEEYLRLKLEAAQKRKSLSAVIREKIGVGGKRRSKAEVARLMEDLSKLARKNAKKLTGWNSLKALRRIRDEPAW